MKIRPIKFRALRSDGKGMVYGVPFMINNCQSLKLTSADTAFTGVEIDPTTLGQYWRTINGVDVYEGDILQCDGILWVLKRDEDGFYIENNNNKTYVYELLKYDIFDRVGNIHTNPEMI